MRVPSLAIVVAVAVFLAAAPAAHAAANDLSVTLAASPSSPVVGDTLTATATVTNAGTTTATGVAVNFHLAGVEDEALTSASCQAFIDVLEICNLPDLAPGRQIQVAVGVTKLSEGDLTVSAGVGYDNVGLDATPADDTASGTSRVRLPGRLKLTLTATPDTVTVGNPVTTTAIVQNTGAGYADAATLKLTLPPELQPGALPTGCTAAGLRITCDLGTIASLGSASRAISLGVPNEGSYVLLGAATLSRADPDPAVAQAAVTGVAPIDPDTPPATPTTPTAPRLRNVSLGSLVEGAPAVRACLRARTLDMLLRTRHGSAVRRLDVRLGARRVRRLTGSALGRPFTVHTPASGAFTLTLVATLRDDSTLRAARPLRACRRSGHGP